MKNIGNSEGGRESLAKRLFDFFLALTGIVLSSPLWIVIAILIYLEDRGSVLFRQLRVGKKGSLFTAYKFRTMKSGSNTSVPAREEDPRITKIGRILRAMALDELPQLYNILKGDLSFVGPRALIPEELEINPADPHAEFLRPLVKKRSEVVPGLTGIAQIFAPRDTPFERKLRYDLIYIKKRSFFLDLKLIAISFLISFLGRWESRKSKLNLRKREVRV